MRLKEKMKRFLGMMMAFALVLSMGTGMTVKADTTYSQNEEEINSITVVVPEAEATVKVYQIIVVVDATDDDNNMTPYAGTDWASEGLGQQVMRILQSGSYEMSEELAEEVAKWSLGDAVLDPGTVLEGLSEDSQNALWYAIARELALSADEYGLEPLASAYNGADSGYTEYIYTSGVNTLTLGQYMTVVTGQGYIYQPTTITVIPELDPVSGEYEEVEQNPSVEVKKSEPGIEKDIDDNYVAYGDTATFTITVDVPFYAEDYDYNTVLFDVVDVMSNAFTYDTGSLKVYGISTTSGVDTEIELDDSAYILYGTFDRVYYDSETGDRLLVYSSTISSVSLVTGTADGSSSGSDAREILESLAGENGYTYTDETAIQISFDYESVMQYSQLKITYTATITEDTVVGAENNENYNDVYLRYSTNPAEPEIPTTIMDEEVVYTFGIDILKVDATDASETLSGAIFTLYQQIDAAMDFEAWAEIVTAEDYDESEYYYEENADGTIMVAKVIATNLVTGDDGRIQVDGLDVGTYYLQETKAPSGYNLDDQVRTLSIVASTVEGQEYKATGTDYDGLGEESTSVSTTYGHIATTVLNAQGITLPSTGGMGTTIFMVIGIVLMGGAMVLIVVRQKRRTRVA